MAEHWIKLGNSAPPLFIFGMVIGTAEQAYQAIPTIIKAASFVVLAVGAFYDIKADIRVIQANQIHAGKERDEFRAFMMNGERCTLQDCNQIRHRLDRLEDRVK